MFLFLESRNFIRQWVSIRNGVGLLELAGYLGDDPVLCYLCSLDLRRYGMMAVLLGLVLLMFVYVFTYPKYEADQVMSAFFGIVYVAVMLSFIFLTRNLAGGKFLVWLIFLCSWGMRYLCLLRGNADRQT